MAFIIIAAILLPIALLLCCRVHVYASYDVLRSLAGVRYLFIRYEYDPDKPAKPKKEKKKAQEEPQEQPAPKRKIDLARFRELFDQFYTPVKNLSASLLKRLRVDRFELDAAVCEQDAAQTAIEYGLLCSAVFPVTAFINAHLRVKRQSVTVRPVFNPQSDAEQSSVRFFCDLSIRLGPLVWSGIRAAAAFFLAVFRSKSRKSAAGPSAKAAG